MSLRVYNTLSKTKELFDPVKPGKVGMYLCGPTVYKSPHIGHMVGPVIFDTVKRYLVYKGYEVTWVVNITDIDDKLIDAAARKGESVEAVAQKYTAEYMNVLASMGIDTIDRFPKATEHLNDIIALCKTLIDRGHAYAGEGNVYFDVSRDPDYGKLSNRRVEEQESGTRATEASGKRNPADFALWKASKPGEPAFDSPWGPGRPGWHIECSAMSMKYLGESFDIHGGGMDLMFPHHENELAQSECATGKPFAKFWLHNGLTRVKTKTAGGELKVDKLSGSDIAAGLQDGSAVDAQALIDAHGAELLRYLLLSTHYRRPIEFTDDVLTSSKKGLGTFTRVFERVERIVGKPIAEDEPDIDRVASSLLETEAAGFVRAVLGLKMRYLEMMDDDFNTAGAIACLHDLAGQVNAFVEQHQVDANRQSDMVPAIVAATQTLRKLGMVIGLFRKLPSRAATSDAQSKNAGLTEQLMQLFIRLRAEARASKNFALADAVRKGLTDIGVTLEDRPDATVWRKD